MNCKLVNLYNEGVGEVNLNPSIFSVNRESGKLILHDIVKWQLSKRRSGTHKTKGISDISGTTAKPYKQKRTGRARQGSLRSPQFRGGAVIFGPVVRDHAYSLNKKIRKLGFKIALSLKYSNGKLIILDNIHLNSSKTSEMKKCIDSFKFPSCSTLLIVADYDKSISLACSNLPRIDIIKPVGINVLDLLNHDYIILTVDVLSYLETRLL
ncbi:MAG: 50S ribosomal protein L4 [Candidatus Mesenet longicola]|uniref:Large ribosomal subunit protein uL4 n=1 Tax=Candidatus Mesenet longicola TaxID=1892558 RepID=A0A8J3HNV7_9RICK|nr:MAG: 50S ribosomal protein L4 [Candidatus Mesenet longicola]GHM59151.1 MAG: 50S ribosomal protein L4 [Candidatus Mesenet longicola]